MSRVAIRPLARRDLKDIWNYSVTMWGVDRAESYIRAIHHTMELLAATPALGRSCDEVRPGYRRHPSGSHIVFYRISSDGIDVVRILHARMDHERHL